MHFLLAAAVIVALDAWLVAPAERTIRVSEEEIARAAGEREAELGRPLKAEERRAVAARLADDEILRREAIARGLDRSPAVRALLVQRMRRLLTGDFPPADEAELRAWYDEHPDRFVIPARFDFDQVVFRNAADAPPGLRERLQAGAEFWTLGDPVPEGASVRGETETDLARRHGAAFVDQLREATPEVWWQVEGAGDGAHFVRLRGFSPAVPLPFEEAEARVRRDRDDARGAESVERELAGLRTRYRIVREGTP